MRWFLGVKKGGEGRREGRGGERGSEFPLLPESYVFVYIYMCVCLSMCVFVCEVRKGRRGRGFINPECYFHKIHHSAKMRERERERERENRSQPFFSIQTSPIYIPPSQIGIQTQIHTHTHI